MCQGDGQHRTEDSEKVASNEKTSDQVTEEEQINDELEAVAYTREREQELHTPEEKSPPKPIQVLRRSVRERRISQRYDQYVMYSLIYMLWMHRRIHVF